MNVDKLKNNYTFSIEQEERSTSTEKLNESIRIGSPGGILLIIALVIAAAGLILWGFIGRIPVTITEPVVVVGSYDDTHICVGFIDVKKNTGVIADGKEANILMPDGRSFKGKLVLTNNTPLSADEIKYLFGSGAEDTDEEVLQANFSLSDWMLDNLLGNSSYSYMFYIETADDINLYWHQIGQATIITGEITPISLLMK